MTTKPPSKVKEFDPASVEKIAYGAVATIETVETNDRNRLGYHVWRWLTSREGTIEDAIAQSGARLKTSRGQAIEIIKSSLRKSGISVD